MKYLSVCSGIEAATVAWRALGWEPVAFSEIEAFPAEVLKYHYPEVPNLGDMNGYRSWSIKKPVELLVGGTPCVSFSVAGLRRGLLDPRGGLMLTYLEIAQRFRPQWIVWENVPGVLSSNGGRDFGSFLGALGELGYGWAYRVLDAQWFGVAQRRRRVFVVGCLGDQRAAAKILFESESVCRNPAPSREKRERVAPSVSCGAPFSRTGNERVECDAIVTSFRWQNDNEGIIPDNLAATIKAGSGTDERKVGALITARMAAFGEYVDDGTASTLKQRDYKDATDLVAQPIVFHPTQDPISSSDGTTHAMGCGSSTGQASVAVGAFFAGQGAKAGGIAYNDHVSPTLKAGDSGTNRTPTAHIGMQVRRLTPVECERLQGFPDDYTAIPWRKGKLDSFITGNDCPDGPRYKALGNSMAVPVMRWIGSRIKQYEEHQRK